MSLVEPPLLGTEGADLPVEPGQDSTDVAAPRARPEHPSSGWMFLTQTCCAVLAVLLLGFVLNLVVVSRVEYKAAQHRMFDKFRQELALGTAPVGQTQKGRLLALGSPVAILDIPSIGVHDVVGEGTTASVLMSGPGHRRDTPLPGQGGGVASYILGRAGAYGGPFSRLHELKVGAKISVTTGQGVSTFKVRDIRRRGDPQPPAPTAVQGRLTLETATESWYTPSGILLVDADLTSATLVSNPAVIAVGGIPADERPMGTEPGTIWALVLWMQALLVVTVTGIWSWRRWGRAQTWIVFVPVMFVVAFFLFNQVDRLLPNLL